MTTPPQLDSSQIVDNSYWIDSRGNDDRPSVAWFSDGFLCHAFLAKSDLLQIAIGALHSDKATTKTATEDVLTVKANADENWMSVCYRSIKGKTDDFALYLENSVKRDELLAAIESRAKLNRRVTKRLEGRMEVAVIPTISTALLASFFFLSSYFVPSNPLPDKKVHYRIDASSNVPKFSKEEESLTRTRSQRFQYVASQIGPTGMVLIGSGVLIVGALVICRRCRNRTEIHEITLDGKS